MGNGKPEDIVLPVETIVTHVRWQAAFTKGIMCACGHLHYGRIPNDRPNMAPQWHLCKEHEQCGCKTLRMIRATNT